MKKQAGPSGILKKLIVTLLAAVLVYLTVTAAGIVSFSKKDETRPADTAIVLGAAVYDNSPSPVFCERINHAVDLYNDGYVKTIIMTGGVGEGNIRSEADIAREYAEQKGVPAESILVEEESKITAENLENAKRIMTARDMDTALIVSDPLHMKRAMLYAQDLDMAAYSSPTPTTLYRSLGTKLPFLIREDFYYAGYGLARLTGNRIHSQTKLEEIRERGVLKVGTAGDYMPMSYLDPKTGSYVGFDAELAEDLADALDVELEYVETSWPALMDDTLAGKFDLAICGITITDTRKEQALMSDGYLENGKTLLCRAEDAGKYTGLEAINRPEVRVMENPGGTNEKFVREKLPDASLTIHDVNQEIPGLVASGEADVMITEIVEAGYYVGQDDRLAAPLIHEPFTRGQIGVLMPKGSEDLLDYVNGFLIKEKENGRLDELAGNYFFMDAEDEEELRPAA